MRNFYLFQTLLFCSLILNAQNKTDSLSTPFDNWSEDRFVAYCDSLYNAHYPPAITIYNTSNEDTAQGDSNVTFSINRVISPVSNSDIDRTKAVGGIPINSGITPSGARTYEIPLDIYPGINGMTPSLSLTYNSQQGNSFMGCGWTIGGLRNIIRIPKTVYHNGKTAPITRKNDDCFAIDGIRLIKITDYPSYTLYESEQGNIKLKGFHNDSIITHFEVHYPDGSKGIFGFPETTRHEIYYPITELKDSRKNVISYEQKRFDNFYYITKINYNTDVSIEFEYKNDRPDMQISYTSGYSTRIRKLLNSITCKLGSNITGKYTFVYETKYNRSILTEIGYTSNSQSYNPIKFLYGENSNINSGFNIWTSRTNDRHHSTVQQAIRLVKGRFDPITGSEGIITLRNHNPYHKVFRTAGLTHHSSNRFENKYDPLETIYPFTNLSGEIAVPIKEITAGNGFIDIINADLRGNYQDCVIKINDFPDDDTNETLTFEIYENISNKFNKTLTRSYSFPTVVKDGSSKRSIQPKFFYPGDFNGDGKAELLVVGAHQALGSNSPSTKCYVFDLINDKILYEGRPFNFLVEFFGNQQEDPIKAEQNSDKIFIAELDGDGKSDFCLFNNSGIHTYTFNEAEDGKLSLKKLFTFANPENINFKTKQIVPYEYQGDGLTDFIIPPTDGRTWGLITCKGNGELAYSNFSYESPITIDEKSKFFVADINGDGKPDLNIVNYDDDGYSDLCTYISGFPYFSESFLTHQNKTNVLFAPVNYNSPSIHAPLLGVRDNIFFTYAFSRNDIKETMVSSMINSFGVVQNNSYETLSKISPNFTFGTNAEFPFANIAEVLNVMTKTTKFLNSKTIASDKYSYKNAVTHLQGLGFCGFEKIAVTNLRGQVTEQTFDPYNYGVLKSQVSPTNKSTFSYSIDHTPQSKVSILLRNKSEEDLLKNLSTRTSYTYDSYGFPISENSVIEGYGNISTNYSYLHETSYLNNYRLGLQTECETTVTTSHLPTSTYTTRTTTDYANGQPICIRSFIGNSQLKEKKFVYDSFGNITSESVRPYSSQTEEITKYTYDSHGRLLQTTNNIGLTRSNTYDNQGHLASIKDERGNTTTFGYDEFGRQISEVSPDGVISKNIFEWTSEAKADKLYSIIRSTTGTPNTKDTYDALGRLVESSEIRFDGSWLKTVKQYDNYGNLIRASLPTKATTPTLWDEYTYDEYDRLVSRTEASGKKTTHLYEGNSVVTTEDNLTSTRFYNPRGELIEIDDPVGFIRFTLHADGQPISIEDPNGYMTEFEYDDLRRRIKITDSNSGSIETGYDEAGNIIYEDNEEYYYTGFEYDKHNRLKTKTIDVSDFNYTYNEYGDLTSISSISNTEKDISYDSFGRISSVTSYCGNNMPWLRRDYTYSNGNISSIAYTSDKGKIATENYSYSNGHLVEIKLNGNTSIYKLTEENDIGLTSKISTGIFNRLYGFTSAGLPSSRIASCSATQVQNYSYSFYEPTITCSGFNLKTRADLISGKTENFSYDNDNRLTNWGNVHAVYDMMGNILTRSDIGDFKYKDIDRPYAISEMRLHSDSVSLGRQVISYYMPGRPQDISENNIRAHFDYDSNLDRYRMTLRDSSGSFLTKYYLGNCYEYEHNPKTPDYEERLYLGGNYYDAHAILIKGNGTEELYYLFRDYLGSITQICKADGTLVQELEYSPWGEIKSSSRTLANSTETKTLPIFGRGFTGHEHLPWYGLINMNARLYDPMIGRFLSPDPYVQAPEYGQNYNRYSYALNNPLCYVDEDGEFIWMPIIIGGTMNVMANWMNIVNAGGGWKSVWKGIGYFAVGGVAGAVTGGISNALPSIGIIQGALSGFCSGSAAGLILGSCNTLISGGSISDALKAGATEALWGGVAGAAFGAIEGGVNAYESGKNILTGKDIKPSVTTSDVFKPRNSSAISIDDLSTMKNKRDYTGYYGYDQVTGDIKYVGITRRDPEIRFQEHRRSGTVRSDLKFEPVKMNMTKMEARIWEQQKIINYGMFKNGGQLYNLRNEISPKLWHKYNIIIPKEMKHNIFQNLKH